jgi:glycogen debranching enzyme
VKPEIKVGAPRLNLHHGYTVMACERDGQIEGGDKGLYFLDTRLICGWRVFINDRPWTLLNSGALTASAARIYFVNPQVPCEGGVISEHSLGLTVGRHLDGGLHEDIDIANHGGQACRFLLEIEIQGDFADLFDVKAARPIRRGTILMDWDSAGLCLTSRYRNKDFSRAFRVTAKPGDAPPTFANGRLSFALQIPPGGGWHACLLYDFADAQSWVVAPKPCIAEFESGGAAENRRAWRHEVVKLETGNDAFGACFSQALDDMAALRLPIEGTDEVKFVPAAGLPWFVALFGRDSLVISLQTAIVHPGFARGALDVLAKWQARERDDYRDAEPGKIHHELRRGELAHFKLIPHTPYYGTADATPLYIVTLHSAFMANGERGLLTDHLGTAERCLAWIDDYGDRDCDGFQEYQTRSSDGYENQSWKDSGEALVNVDGSLVKGPKATCELQGYVYDAWLRMAQLYDYLDRHDRAEALRAKAASLFERFNLVFWNEKEGTYAFALDGDKQQVRSVASNAGQCLWSGIVPPDRARRVADRLMQSDMWSGWGIRTLSAAHRSFNPFHYQIGAVWPHDNGFIAMGMTRYGFRDEACRIAQAVADASSYFEKNRIPELYAGITREPGSFPAQYLGANVPQGWAAGAIFSLLQALLGFQPDAPAGRLYVDPALPDWMPALTVRDLKVGGDKFDIRFRREGAKTLFDVLRGPARRVEFRAMARWAELLQGR